MDAGKNALETMKALVAAKKSEEAEKEAAKETRRKEEAAAKAAELRKLIPDLVVDAMGFGEEWYQEDGSNTVYLLGRVNITDTDGAVLAVHQTSATATDNWRNTISGSPAIVVSVAGEPNSHMIGINYWDEARELFAEWLLDALEKGRVTHLIKRDNDIRRYLATLTTAPKGTREGIEKQLADAETARAALIEIVPDRKEEADRLFAKLRAACSEKIRKWDESEKLQVAEREAEEAYVKALTEEMRKAEERATQNVDTCNRFQALVNTHKFPVYELKYAVSAGTSDGYYETEERTVYAMRQEVGLQLVTHMWWWVYEGIELKRVMFPFLTSITEIDHVDMPNPHVGEDVEHMGYMITINPATPAKLVQEWKAALVDDSLPQIDLPAHAKDNPQLTSRLYWKAKARLDRDE